MRLFHIQDDQFVELLAMPDMPPARGYLWLGIDRQEFDAKLASLQIAAMDAWPALRAQGACRATGCLYRRTH